MLVLAVLAATAAAQSRSPGLADIDNAYRQELQAEQAALGQRIRQLPAGARELNARIGEAMRAGDTAGALVLSLRLDALYPDQADVQNFIASLHARDGRSGEALERWEMALRIAPDNRWFAVNKAGIQAEMGRLADALATADALIARSPGWSIAHNLRAGLLHDLGRDPEALDAYALAIAAAPASAQILSNRADLLAMLGRKEGAIADYQRALAVQPGYARAEEGLVRLR